MFWLGLLLNPLMPSYRNTNVSDLRLTRILKLEVNAGMQQEIRVKRLMCVSLKYVSERMTCV